MAIDADGKMSYLEQDSEVIATPSTREQLALEVEELNDCLFSQDKLIKRAARERKELKAELETALHELEVLKSASTSSAASDDMPEYAEYETHMSSLASLQSKYASLVDELDNLGLLWMMLSLD